MPRTALPETAEEAPSTRRSWRPVLWALLGAVIAVVAVVAVDRLGADSGSEQAAAPTTAPTSTTLAPPVGEKVHRIIQPSLVLVQAFDADGSTSLGSGVIVNRKGRS